MYKLIINAFAEETLEKVSLKDKKTYLRLSKALDSLEQNGLQSSNITSLKNAPKIFRKRLLVNNLSLRPVTVFAIIKIT